MVAEIMPYADRQDRLAYNRRHWTENREWYRKRSREHRVKTGYQAGGKAGTRNPFSMDEFDAMLKAQDYRCAMPDCRSTDPGGRWKQWHIDHDHETGRIRGLLCHMCNTWLGYYERHQGRFSTFQQYVTAGKDS